MGEFIRSISILDYNKIIFAENIHDFFGGLKKQVCIKPITLLPMKRDAI